MYAIDKTYLQWSLYKMGMLTKVQILEARNRRKTQIIDVPEWFDNGQVIIIELSGKERDAFEADMIQLGTNGKQKINLRNIRAKLVARCIVDPDDFDIIDIPDNAPVKDFAPDLTVKEMNSNAGLQHLMNISKVGKRAVLKQDHMINRMFNDIETADLGDVSATALQRVFDAAQKLSGITKEDVEELAGDLKNDQSADFGSN